MTQGTVQKPVANNALIELDASLRDFDSKRNTLLKRLKHPDSISQDAVNDSVKQYYDAFERVNGAIRNSLRKILDAAKASSPYYELPQGERDRIYGDFLKNDRKLIVKFDERFVNSFSISYPGAEFRVYLSLSGEGGPNLVDKANKIGINAEFERIKN